MKTKFSKPVAFNTKNKKDRDILEYVKRKNFSGFVKTLILSHMETNDFKVEEKAPQPLTTAERLEQLRNKK